MPINTAVIHNLETRMRQNLQRYREARLRGDFLEVVFVIHTTLEDTFNAHLDPQARSLDFCPKAQIVLPQFYATHNIEGLNRQRNNYAHPSQQFSDNEIRNTATGFVNLTLAGWTTLFPDTQPPRVIHPGGPVSQKIAWSYLISGFLLLWPTIWLASYLYQLWGEMSRDGFWRLSLTGMWLILVCFLLSSFWRFFQALDLRWLIGNISTGLLLITLLLTPFVDRGESWADRAGVALAYVLNFLWFITIQPFSKL